MCLLAGPLVQPRRLPLGLLCHCFVRLLLLAAVALLLFLTSSGSLLHSLNAHVQVAQSRAASAMTSQLVVHRSRQGLELGASLARPRPIGSAEKRRGDCLPCAALVLMQPADAQLLLLPPQQDAAPSPAASGSSHLLHGNSSVQKTLHPRIHTASAISSHSPSTGSRLLLLLPLLHAAVTAASSQRDLLPPVLCLHKRTFCLLFRSSYYPLVCLSW